MIWRTLLLTFVLVGMVLAEQMVTLLPVQNRSAEALANTLRPLFGESASISAYGNQLIVRASPHQTAEIRGLLKQLDSPPRRLAIDVRVSKQLRLQQQGGSLEGRLGTHDRELQLRGFQASTRARGDSSQTVQTLEGEIARISVGRSVPVWQLGESQDQYGWRLHQEVNYRDVETGFEVLPRLLNDDQVSLEIYQHAEQLGRYGNSFEHQQASSTLHGRLGEWLTLGSVGQSSDRSAPGFGVTANTAQADRETIEVRVRALD